MRLLAVFFAVFLTAAPAKASENEGRFSFGSYGRVVAAGSTRGRPDRDADIVAHGSRLDSPTYAELEMRREDSWATGIKTQLVATLAVGHPVFHYDANFDANIALRNLYIEARDVGRKGFEVWAGSRMLRGDDIYLLDYWPLDNLNTVGGGLGWSHRPSLLRASMHVGVARPDHPFYRQIVTRPAPLDQFGSADVALLDRQRWIGSARIEKVQRIGAGPAGLKFVAYGEGHALSSGQKQADQPQIYEPVHREQGFVLGGQIGAFSGQRDTHLNLFFRYASGLAAYDSLAAATGLGPDRTTAGARETVFALSGNGEWGRVGVMLAGYVRAFRNASPSLDFGDIDEAIAVLRPQLWLNDWFGVAIEGSIQTQQRGVLRQVASESGASTSLERQTGQVARAAVMPFVSPAGRGSFKRPIVYLLYHATARDEGARRLYPDDDPFARDGIEHVFGLGAEWWFNSSSYSSPVNKP
jgi:maltoporin